MKLPIDSLLPEIQQALRSGTSLILRAAPGAGKTTRVPPALLPVVAGQVLVLEPRRLAARLSAERVASEMNEACGDTTGYHIRYERAFGPRTRIKFITEGLFLRLLLADPLLGGVDCVILDEFHERHLQSDVTLALVRHLQATVRKDLKLVIMSATLETNALQSYLPEARVLESDIRAHPVETEFLKHSHSRPLEDAVFTAVAGLVSGPPGGGHILVFLPGAAEIRRAAERLAPLADQQQCLLLELRSETPADQQRRVFEATARRKIILATNVAETSITIDGVTAVVDSGLARIPGHDPWSGLPLLETKPVSRASCIQRAGRAGRTAPGKTVRLYTEHDFRARPAAEKPEIQRLDLTQVLLELQSISQSFPAGARFSADSLPWLDAPPPGMIQGCTALLRMLGALDAGGGLTATGRLMTSFPLHPRLSRAIVEGQRLNAAPHAALAAALLNEGMIAHRDRDADAVAHSDVSHQMELLRGFLKGHAGAAARVNRSAASRAERLARSLADASGCRFGDMLQPPPEETLALALLAGFPDRVAQVRRTSKSDRIELLMCAGGTAVLSSSSTVRDSEFLLALEAEESRAHGAGSSTTRIHAACGLEKEMLLSGSPELLREDEAFWWDAEAQRAQGSARLRYGTIVLEERMIRKDPRLEEVLRAALKQQWPRPFPDAEPLESLARRAALLQECGIPLDVPDLKGAGFDQLLHALCEGRSAFAEVRQQSLTEALHGMLSPRDLKALRDHAPESVTIGSGRKAQIHYEEAKPPWIESALQDFFGTRVTPSIAGGRVRLVVHLLAPNRRPVQVTQDLENFWNTHYPQMRNALMRRYPKQAWPEDPLHASPPAKRKPGPR